MLYFIDTLTFTKIIFVPAIKLGRTSKHEQQQGLDL